jgi:hypothetical protein
MRIFLTCALLFVAVGCTAEKREQAAEFVKTAAPLVKEAVIMVAADDPDWFSFGEKIIMTLLGLGAAGVGAKKLKDMKPKLDA